MGKIKIKPISGNSRLPGFKRVMAEICHGVGRRELLWFEVGPTAHDAVMNSGNIWLMALLPLAFDSGKSLEISAPVDATLLANVEKIQSVWQNWFPSRRRISIHAPVLKSTPNQNKTGLFFTGGVDSFFSLLHADDAVRSQLGENLKPVEDLIFVWGFDIPLENIAAFERKSAVFFEIAKRFGKTPVVVATNLRQTELSSLDWGARACGLGMGAVGHLLGKRYSQLLISSSGRPEESLPWGSHPLVDQFMSSAQTQFTYYARGIDRFSKTRRIALDEVALKYLHVCWQARSDQNCGRCEKCLRTLLTLELLGVREKVETFSRKQFSWDHIQNLKFTSEFARELFADLRKYAVEFNRPDLVAVIDACLTQSKIIPTGSRRKPWHKRLRKWLKRTFV